MLVYKWDFLSGQVSGEVGQKDSNMPTMQGVSHDVHSDIRPQKNVIKQVKGVVIWI